jgi:glutaredoxin 3
MAKIEVYSKSWCPYSKRAKQDLEENGVSYDENDVTSDSVREQEMINRSGRTSVPQIFIDGYHLGGSDDLRIAEANGQLDRLLSRPAQEKAA